MPEDTADTLTIEEDWDGTPVVRHNIPAEGPLIEPVSSTETTYYIDVQQEGVPSPKMFHDLGTAASKLLVLGQFLPEAYAHEAERLWEDVDRLRRMLARERCDDRQAVRDLCLGDLTVLPEVDAEREQVRHGGYQEDSA